MLVVSTVELALFVYASMFAFLLAVLPIVKRPNEYI